MGIQEYLDDLSNNNLKQIKYRYREKIIADIQDRMCSLLSRWDDEPFRKTVLFITDEEALFYEPDAPNDVKRFVVATVRNSMLEIAASNSCGQFKMNEPLLEEEIKTITSEAILYFRQCDFYALQKEAAAIPHTDVYKEAIQKYPLAWEILQKAALMDADELAFAETHNTSSSDFENKFAHKDHKTVDCDGYSLEFDEYLVEELGKVLSGLTDVFYVDCFKMLARNFEKVLHVLQIILEHNNAFATCNYYISNGHIEKRKRILRAAHNARGALFHNMRNKKGAPPRLRKVLEKMTGETTVS